MLRIKKGDTVQIMAGKERGKTGKVLDVNPDRGTVQVEGLNVYKKHQRPKKQGEKGEVIEVSRPVRISNALPYCEKCKKGVRVSSHRDNKSASRVCKKCGAKLS